MLNKVFLTGRPTANPKLYERDSGTLVTFSIAVNGRKTKDGTRESMFLDCTVCGKQAEIVNSYVRKGTLLTVVGRLYQTRYDDKNGVQHTKVCVAVDEVELYGKEEEPKPQEIPTPQPTPQDPEITDDELPF